MKIFILAILLVVSGNGMNKLLIKKIKESGKQEAYCNAIIKAKTETTEKNNPLLRVIFESDHYKSVDSCLKLFK